MESDQNSKIIKVVVISVAIVLSIVWFKMLWLTKGGNWYTLDTGIYADIIDLKNNNKWFKEQCYDGYKDDFRKTFRPVLATPDSYEKQLKGRLDLKADGCDKNMKQISELQGKIVFGFVKLLFGLACLFGGAFFLIRYLSPRKP